MIPSRRMSDQFKMCHFASVIFNETKIISIHKQAEWETIIIKTNPYILGNTLFLFLSFLCSICSEAIMTAVPGLYSLYTNRVKTFWHLYPVYNQTFLSSPLTPLCGFCWAVFKWWKQEVSWGCMDEWGGRGLFCLLGWCLSQGNLSESHSLQVHIARFKLINSPSHYLRRDEWAQWMSGQ